MLDNLLVFLHRSPTLLGIVGVCAANYVSSIHSGMNQCSLWKAVSPIPFYLWTSTDAGEKGSLCTLCCPTSCEQQLNAILPVCRDAVSQKLHLFSSTLGNRWVWRQRGETSGHLFFVDSKEVPEENKFPRTCEDSLVRGAGLIPGLRILSCRNPAAVSLQS